ncbi:MAG: carboxylesterase family protein [Agarilytica sp.]
MRIAIYISKAVTLSILLLSNTTIAKVQNHPGTELIKDVTGGSIQGSADKHNTVSFKGIPYAKAPVGDLRWKAPQDNDSWEGVREASEFGDVCPQAGTIWGTTNPDELGTSIGNEDCLFLNVWRPNENISELPVFVWIHGGSNARGTATSSTFHGAKLANTTKAIVVTLNFRLGALGWLHNDFLQGEDPLDASGNYALLDMMKGLEWIQNNIQTFGGNPNQVTIAGNSSGCSSVWGLMQSDLSEDLFDQAICSAGFPSGLPAVVGNAISDGLIDNLLVMFGHATTVEEAIAFRSNQTSEWIDTFMRSVPANLLATLVPRSAGNFIDGHVLENAGVDAMQGGHFHRKPLMLGSTKDEASYIWGVIAGFFNNAGASNPLLWEQLIADPELLELEDILLAPYAPLYPGVVAASSYAWSLATDNVASFASNFQEDVYRYDFNFDDIPAPWNSAFGATHTFDLPFMFGNFDANTDTLYSFAWTDTNENSREQVSQKFMSYLARFMRTGSPNAPWQNPQWQAWNENSLDDRRIQFDHPMSSSNDRFTFEEFESLRGNLAPFSQSLVDSFITGMPLSQ